MVWPSAGVTGIRVSAKISRHQLRRAGEKAKLFTWDPVIPEDKTIDISYATGGKLAPNVPRLLVSLHGL